MPHLNGLQESYGSKGLTILAVTSTREDREKTAEWIDKRGVEYPVAWDSDGKLAAWFGVRGIPHAVLVDPAGEIVWRGHPAQLDEKAVERALEGTLPRPLWEYPSVWEPFSNGKLAPALAAAEKLEGGAPVVAVLRARIEGRLQAIKAALADGDFLWAQELAERSAGELAGLPEAITAAEIVTWIAQDPDAQAILSAQIELRPLVGMVDQVRTMTAAKDLLAELEAMRTRLPGTIVERRAKDAIARLKKRMEG